MSYTAQAMRIHVNSTYIRHSLNILALWNCTLIYLHLPVRNNASLFRGEDESLKEIDWYFGS